MSSLLALHSILTLSAALLLAVAGIAKLWRPTFTTGALSTVGLPSAPVFVRLFAVVEIVVAIDVLGWSGIAPVLALSILYAGFVVFSAVLLRRDPGASCGCFGTGSPISPVHVVVNAAVALVTAAAVVTGTVALPRLLDDGPWPPAVPILLVLAVTGLLLLLLTRAVGSGSTSIPPTPDAGRPLPASITGVLVAPSTPHPGPGPGEESTTVDLRDTDTVAVLLSPTCLTCRTIWRELHRPRRALLPRGIDLLILVERDADLTAVAALAPTGPPVLAVDGVLDHLGVPGAPWAIRVDGTTGRTVAEGTGSSWAELRRLLGF